MAFTSLPSLSLTSPRAWVCIRWRNWGWPTFRARPLAANSLADATLAPRIDWLRPASAKELSLPSPASAAVILLIGPGSVNLLRTTLEWLAAFRPPAVWAFLMPNALMEESVLRSAPAQHLANLQAYQLPDSSPQTLWFILMEQLGKLSVMDELALQHAHNLSQTNDMSSNLKQCMDTTMTIDGALAAAVVDYRSGMCLAQAGSGMNLTLAAAGNTEVVKAKLKTMEMLGCAVALKTSSSLWATSTT